MYIPASTPSALPVRPPQAGALRLDERQIPDTVLRALATTRIYDLHTHIYPPAFGPLLLRGIDELLNYHYLQAEALRADGTISYDQFWSLAAERQAEFIWQTLFLDRAPISEAARGVLTTLRLLGCEVESRNLAHYRAFFAGLSPEEHVDRVFRAARVHTVVMTNNAFDPLERRCWQQAGAIDPRFKGVVRIDPLLREWPQVGGQLTALRYPTRLPLDAEGRRHIRRFLEDWVERVSAIYVAASLTPEWRYPDDSLGARILEEIVLPLCRERGLPFALMIGVRPQVNPKLRVAGDSVGPAHLPSIDRLCTTYPENLFMLTALSRESQHEAAVAARKHRNLFLFGCWWFMNNPVLIEETTRMRMEMLGTSFVPQHSDSRVLDQLVYKWAHFREIIARVLAEKFCDLARTGWPVTEAEIRRTVEDYLSGNFTKFLEFAATSARKPT
jgi:hypothetical protein